MLKSIFAILAVLVGAGLVYVATRPDHFRIERSVTLHCSPDKVYALISDFHRWEAWSPWEKVDPQIHRSYSGAASGLGAIYEWSGNKDIGRGRMEITDAQPASKLVIKTDFITPFEAHNTVEFVLTRQGEATVLTQAMYGPSPFVSKLMGLVFNMDKMVGDKYEEGFASLKALAEKQE